MENDQSEWIASVDVVSCYIIMLKSASVNANITFVAVMHLIYIDWRRFKLREFIVLDFII